MNPTAKPILYSDCGYQYKNRTFKIKFDKIKVPQSIPKVSSCINNGL